MKVVDSRVKPTAVRFVDGITAGNLGPGPRMVLGAVVGVWGADS